MNQVTRVSLSPLCSGAAPLQCRWTFHYSTCFTWWQEATFTVFGVAVQAGLNAEEQWPAHTCLG